MLKIIGLILSFWFIVGCETTNVKPTYIKIPQADARIEIENLNKAKANKIKIGERNNYVFDFYPGPRGSYYVVISPKNPKKTPAFSLDLYDAILEVDMTGEAPETILLALEYNQIYSGFGSTREGLVNYTLKLVPIDSSMGKEFYLNFKAKIPQF